MDAVSNENQICFMSILSRLREFSKNAIVSADSTIEDSYTMYIHVDRPVQDKFESILKKHTIQITQN